MILTPDEAKKKKCFIEQAGMSFGSITKDCIADDCMAWRWIAIEEKNYGCWDTEGARETTLKEASKVLGKYDKKMSLVFEHDQDIQINIVHGPTHGYCGLAGKPEV